MGGRPARVCDPVFAVTTIVGADGWLGYVQATAEASMVGGLADWFAVTALFRHPLGLPIPHTAIIPERKDQFGETLGEFIQDSFLTPDSIVARVTAAHVSERLAAWLCEPANAERLAGYIADGAVAIADLIKDEEVHAALEAIAREQLDRVQLAPLWPGARCAPSPRSIDTTKWSTPLLQGCAARRPSTATISAAGSTRSRRGGSRARSKTASSTACSTAPRRCCATWSKTATTACASNSTSALRS